jgi:hypothetical protein
MHNRAKLDNVRASRDGHEYHEAWTARKALPLLWPDNNLIAIAVEGPSPADQARASAQTIEITDITLYYGGRPTFEEASRTNIAQTPTPNQSALRQEGHVYRLGRRQHPPPSARRAMC